MSNKTEFNRTIVVGDIHSAYLALVDVINKIKPTKDDLLIFLGDYTDGWADVIRTIKLLIKLKKKFPHFIFLRGNHDVWVEGWLRGSAQEPAWIRNGGKITHRQLQKEIQKNPEFRQEALDFFSSLHDYYIDDNNRAYIHAGWKHQDGINRAYDHVSNFYWDRTLWESCFKKYKKQVPDKLGGTELKTFRVRADEKPERLKRYHEVFIGHTSTVGYGLSRPFKAFNCYNMDTGAGWFGRLSAMNVETKTTWMSQFTRTLYPNDPHGWEGNGKPNIITVTEDSEESQTTVEN